MSEASKQTKSDSYGQNSDSSPSYKDYESHSNHRHHKKHYETQKYRRQQNDAYSENKGRDNRKHYTYGGEDKSTQDSEQYYKKNYNNGNNQRQEGNYNKHGNHQKWPKKQVVYQAVNVWKKKAENFTKLSKETIVEKFNETGEPNQAFLEIIEANQQIFTKDSQRPVVEQNFELVPEEGILPRPQPIERQEEKEKKEGNEEIAHEQKNKQAEWDDGGDGDYFQEFDIKKIDDPIRKVKSEGNKESESKKSTKLHTEEEEKDLDSREIERDIKDLEKKLWAVSEENGEFSNIDEMFERKLKEKKLQFNEEGEEEFDFGELKKGVPEVEEDNEMPVWEDYDAAAIKRETKDVENMLLGWKSDNEDIRDLNGMIGGTEKFGLFVNDSYDTKNVFPNQKSDMGNASDDEKYAISNFNLKHLDDSSDSDNGLFRAMQPTPITRYHSDNTNNRVEPKFGQPQQIPMQQLPLQQQQQFMQMQMQLFQQQQPMLGQVMAYNFGQTVGFVPVSNPTMQLPVGLEPRPMIPNVFSQFVSYGFKPDAWFYLDRMKIKQGPFTTKQMDEWYMGNHLPSDLPITSGENTNFMPLNDLINLVFKPSGYNDSTKATSTSNPTTPSQSQLSPQQDKSKSEFQFSQLLDNPLLKQLTEKGTSPLPSNIKTAEELEQQAFSGMPGQYGNYGGHHRHRTRKHSGKKNQQNYPQQNRNSYPMNMYPPHQFSSPIGMLQPGLALPQDLGNPNHLHAANQGKKKKTPVQNNPKNTKSSPLAQGADPSDMTNALKMALGIGGGGENALGDFPSLSESNK